MTRTSPHRRRYRVDRRVVLITGAGPGLGVATAHELAGRRARVVIADQDLPAAQRVAAALPHGAAVECDVTDPASVRSAAAATRARFGRLDVVIANAGVLGGGGTFRTLRPGQAERVLEVNVGVCSPRWPPRSTTSSRTAARSC